MNGKVERCAPFLVSFWRHGQSENREKKRRRTDVTGTPPPRSHSASTIPGGLLSSRARVRFAE